MRVAPPRARKRRGVSLLEVMIALSILIASFLPIGQLLALGLRAAHSTQLSSEARFRCESIAAQVLAGSAEWQGKRRGQFSDNRAWRWILDESEIEKDLVEMRVQVRHKQGTTYQLSFWTRLSSEAEE